MKTRYGFPVGLLLITTTVMGAESPPRALLKEGGLSGTVMNLPDSKPVVGTSVVLKNNQPGRAELRATTDEKGSFSFERINAGVYDVFVAGRNTGTVNVVSDGGVTDRLAVLLPAAVSGAAPPESGAGMVGGYHWSIYAVIGGGLVLAAVPLGIAIHDMAKDDTVSP